MFRQVQSLTEILIKVNAVILHPSLTPSILNNLVSDTIRRMISGSEHCDLEQSLALSYKVNLTCAHE